MKKLSFRLRFHFPEISINLCTSRPRAPCLNLSSPNPYMLYCIKFSAASPNSPWPLCTCLGPPVKTASAVRTAHMSTFNNQFHNILPFFYKLLINVLRNKYLYSYSIFIFLLPNQLKDSNDTSKKANRQ